MPRQIPQYSVESFVRRLMKMRADDEIQARSGPWEITVGLMNKPIYVVVAVKKDGSEAQVIEREDPEQMAWQLIGRQINMKTMIWSEKEPENDGGNAQDRPVQPRTGPGQFISYAAYIHPDPIGKDSKGLGSQREADDDED